MPCSPRDWGNGPGPAVSTHNDALKRNVAREVAVRSGPCESASAKTNVSPDRGTLERLTHWLLWAAAYFLRRLLASEELLYSYAIFY